MTDSNQGIKGEGNPEADKRYREGVRETVKSGKVEEKARDAAETHGEELDEIRRAEDEARKRARG